MPSELFQKCGFLNPGAVQSRRLAIRAHLAIDDSPRPCERCPQISFARIQTTGLDRMPSGAQECRCQKQPFTKRTAFHLLNTRSGFPGELFAYKRNRNPNLCAAFLTRISGPVSLERIDRMI